jgi:hypothetical protein
MGCLGGWIVMPEATKLSVSMILSFQHFTALQIRRLERVVVGAIDINHLAPFGPPTRAAVVMPVVRLS